VTEAIVRVRIEGRVQGVWFRAWTAREATELGLRGWVRNRSDGAVEALFAGDARAVGDMVAACHRGPPAARVTSVQKLAAGADELHGDRFVQLPSR
jgi:acylphosphatase